MTSVNDLKKRMLDEFEAGNEPDIAVYIRTAPEARDTLLDYWVLLISTRRLADLGLDQDRGAPNSRRDRTGSRTRSRSCRLSGLGVASAGRQRT